jgi:RNA polymerase subunit RPABC4/transcription elongation factor Spt4
MSGFNNQLRVIPRAAWILAVVGYLCISILLFTVAVPGDRHMRQWNPIGQILFAFGAGLFILVWVLLVGYVYGDAKRRGMPYVMWTLLAIFIPDGIGIILYFILRKAMPKACPGCARDVPSGFVFCPHCGTSLQATCPNCGRGVERGWSNCPHCGTKLPSPGLPANSSGTPR